MISSRKGFLLPLVLFLLFTLSVLGVFLNYGSMHSMRFTARSTDHMRAGYLADAVISACLTQVRNKMNLDPLREFFVKDGASVKASSAAPGLVTIVESRKNLPACLVLCDMRPKSFPCISNTLLPEVSDWIELDTPWNGLMTVRFLKFMEL